MQWTETKQVPIPSPSKFLKLIFFNSQTDPTYEAKPSHRMLQA